MQKAKLLLLFSTQLREVSPRRLQQSKCSKYVGLDKGIRPDNRAVYVAFRGEVDDGLRPVLAYERTDQLFIGDVAMNKDMARISIQRTQVFAVPCVSQIVQIDDRRADVPQPLQNKIGANKPRAPGHQDRTRTVRACLHIQ